MSKSISNSTTPQQDPLKVPRVCMIQDGSRRHYIVPLVLQEAGILERVFADWYIRNSSLTSFLGKAVRFFDRSLGQRMLDRRRSEIDEEKIFTHPLLALQIALARKRFASDELFYDWVTSKLADWVIKQGFGRSNAMYGFIRNVHPRLFIEARAQGLVTIGDQIIAPMVVENMEYQKQQQRWPGWEKIVPNDSLDLVDRIERESWDQCDHVICGSDYVKEGLLDIGISPSKVTVIPYAPSGADLPFVERNLSTSPVVVGFVGGVCLRKGAPVFFEVAKHFDPKRVKFVMVGRNALEPDMVEKKKGHVELLGAIPRSQIGASLEKFHIFFFPSTCEGCAGAVLEAMDTGLPIVSTPNSGTIVRDGIEGFIHQCDDVQGFVRSIEKLVDDQHLRNQMGLASRTRIEGFNSKWYAETLSDLTKKLVSEKASIL